MREKSSGTVNSVHSRRVDWEFLLPWPPNARARTPARSPPIGSMQAASAAKEIAKPPMLIYKILRGPECEAFQAQGRFDGAPIDLADGFIHFSDASQAIETAAKHFAGVKDAWLAAVDPAPLGDELKWEPSRGGKLFPHLYRSLTLGEVLWCKPLPLGAEGHIFPELDP